jgi:transcriptional regulator with XRE-family HTH domain
MKRTGAQVIKRKTRITATDGPDPIDLHVGRRLRLARNLAGVNQTELGEGIDVSFQAVQKYESGDNRISASRLFAAAKFLGCSVAFFFEGCEGSSAADDGGPFLSKELQLIRALRSIMNETARDSIRQLIRQIGAWHSDQDEDGDHREAV